MPTLNLHFKSIIVINCLHYYELLFKFPVSNFSIYFLTPKHKLRFYGKCFHICFSLLLPFSPCLLQSQQKNPFILIHAFSTHSAFNRQLFFNDHFLLSKYNIILTRKLHKTIRTIEYVNAKKTLKKTEKMIPNVNNFNKLQRKHLISHCTKSLRERIENECVYLVHQKIKQNLQSLKNFQLVHF